jgi:hypothetical protein
MNTVKEEIQSLLARRDGQIYSFFRQLLNDLSPKRKLEVLRELVWETPKLLITLGLDIEQLYIFQIILLFDV